MIYLVNKIDFTKKIKALKKYYHGTYLYFIKEALPKTKEKGKRDGVYEIELPTDEDFIKVYGAIKLKYHVLNDVAYLEDIEPGEIFIDMYLSLLRTYKGVPYRNNKDLFKIKLSKEI